ncbi:hypothetical protein [Pseudoalteromonas rubra]|nr:hypothetical protein [Pseudoalteromonas rubra]
MEWTSTSPTISNTAPDVLFVRFNRSATYQAMVLHTSSATS